MDGSLQQEYLYSLLNIAHAYFYSIVEGIARYYVRNMSRIRVYGESIQTLL